MLLVVLYFKLDGRALKLIHLPPYICKGYDHMELYLRFYIHLYCVQRDKITLVFTFSCLGILTKTDFV
jgi:hypothetical protein